MLFVVFYLVNPSIIEKKTFFNYLAELDTIYRQIHQEDDNDTIVENESTKINEYLTYNRFELFLFFKIKLKFEF